jgi:hypothetical protein
MANISITDLHPAGAGLFASSESFIDSIRDLSENELKTTRGGGSNKGSKNKSNKGSYGESCGCGYGCANVPAPTPVPCPCPC